MALMNRQHLKFSRGETCFLSAECGLVATLAREVISFIGTGFGPIGVGGCCGMHHVAGLEHWMMRPTSTDEDLPKRPAETSHTSIVESTHQMLLVIHCKLWLRIRDSLSLNVGLGLFFSAACTIEALPELSVDVKQLSMEQSAIWDGGLSRGFSSRHTATISDRDGSLSGSYGMPKQSFETLIASSENSFLATSTPAVTRVSSVRSLQAFSSIDWRYLLSASIRR
ncbi:hypothetical protein ACLOJK_009468 [Asimina triloba]